MSVLFEGVGVALVTIFDNAGKPDLKATADHAITLVEQGCSAVLLSGTAGESWRLTAEDRIALALELSARRPGVPILVGTGDRNSDRAITITRTVAKAGVGDALLVLSPADAECRVFYHQIAKESAGMPIIAYHLPALSPPGVQVDQLKDLPVAGIKDSSGDADRIAGMLTRDTVPVYVGSPNLLALAGSCGVAGALVAVANTKLDLCQRAWRGDASAQRALMFAHIDSLQSFPAKLKPSR